MAMNKKSGDILEFSNHSEYLSHSDSNGVLRLWDSSSGVLRQEYVSSGHLSSRCHCLAWCPAPPLHGTPKKKRKRNSAPVSVDSLQLVAMGTSTGAILLYSAKKGDLHKTLSGGHDEGVMDVCWSEKGDRLFSCSIDGSVVCWDVETASVESKWTTDPGLSSICLCRSQKHLLTAGRVIQVWDLDTKTLLQSFQGHTSDVLKLAEIPISSHKAINGVDGGDDNDGDDDDDDKFKGVEGSYILSMAADENKISVRQVASACKGLLASFVFPDQPIYLDITHTLKSLKMVVVTKGGSLAYSECHLNGRHKKPMKPVVVMSIMTGPRASKSASKCLPVLVAKLQGGGGGGGDADGGVVCILYGDVVKPAFERINISDLKEILIREDPRSIKVSVEESVVKIKTPTMANDVMLLSSGCVQASKKDGDDGSKPSRKRKKSFLQCQDEITLGDQLSQMTKQSNNAKEPPSSLKSPTISSDTNQLSSSSASKLSTATPPSHPPSSTTTPASSTTTPASFTTTAKTDSLALLLSQGLQSEDKKILNSVLQKSEHLLVRNTVARLPSQCIHPLVKELSRRISGHAQSGKSAIRWMKAVLSIHSSFLTTVPDIEELLNPLVDLLEPSLELLSKMMILKGKLDSMASQFLMLSAPTNNQATPTEPALSTIDPLDDEDEDFMAEDVRHLEISEEDEWEDEMETDVTTMKDLKSSHKTSDFSDGEGSGDDTLMQAD